MTDATVLGPSGHAPPRRRGSIRRTSSIDATWVGGYGTALVLDGRARDLLTDHGGAAVVVGEDRFSATVAPDRTVEAIEATPRRAALATLVGSRGGSGSRRLLADALPDERRAGTPLYLLLDDLSGMTLISGFAFSQWPDEWPSEWRADRRRVLSGRQMVGVCAGFRPGSSALNADGSSRSIHDVRRVEPLAAADDPLGWHPLPSPEGVSMRRARRIDVAVDGDTVLVDAMFQDSSTSPEGGRVAVHEYVVTATASLATGSLLDVQAEPRVLPFAECPAAAANVRRMIGTPLGDLREAVLQRLEGTVGCTHLNDALRAFAEVPQMVDRIR